MDPSVPHQRKGALMLLSLLWSTSKGYLAHTLIAWDIQDLCWDQEERFRAFRLKYKDLPSGVRIWLIVLFPKERPSKACSLRTSRKAMVTSQTQVLQLLLIQTDLNHKEQTLKLSPSERKDIASDWKLQLENPRKKTPSKRSTSLWYLGWYT